MRRAALAVGVVLRGGTLPSALDAAIASDLPDASRAAARDIAYRTVRRLGLVRALARRLGERPAAPPVLALQLVALAQIVDPVRETHVTVDQAVEAAKADASTRAAAGFLNATLRRFLREREALLAAVAGTPEVDHALPGWWLERLRREHPDDWSRIVAIGNEPPPLVLRVDARRSTPAAYAARLAEVGLTGTVVGPQAVRVEPPVPVTRLPGWDDAIVTVQDAGAQLAAPLLEPRDGMRVLDACAAPGGKATHILELADCALTALDADPARLERVAANLARARRSARLLTGDASTPSSWWDGVRFDRILVDAPCTASGILRRQPDVRWLRRRRDIDTLAARQGAILAALWPLLEPGGKLLYVTCSVFRAEGEGVAEAFGRATPAARRCPLRWSFEAGAAAEPIGQLLPTHVAGRDHDGFFYALFEKDA